MTTIHAAIDGWGGLTGLPVGTRRIRKTRPYTGRHRHLAIFPAGFELYRMHAKPHLYPAWLRDATDDAWTAYITRIDKVSWDCDWCRCTVVADSLDDRCPNCGH